jgi:lipopolysaccharide/colanic/teichoic acid biosynthesis glycosyltransferase
VISPFALLIVAAAAAVIFIEDRQNPFFAQERLGRHKKPFTLYKLRTMHVGTPNVTSHSVSRSSVTRPGRWIRRFKIDELPQLLNVIAGQMSLVGPRPGLVGHGELTEARERHGVFRVRPGITGLSQIREIDMSEPERLARSDAEYISSQGFFSDLSIVLATITGSGSGDRVQA